MFIPMFIPPIPLFPFLRPPPLCMFICSPTLMGAPRSNEVEPEEEGAETIWSGCKKENAWDCGLSFLTGGAVEVDAIGGTGGEKG